MSCPTLIRDIAYAPTVDKEACERCMKCVASCYRNVFNASKEGPVVANPQLCVGCRACIKACAAHGAIKITSGALADERIGVVVNEKGRLDYRSYAHYGRDAATGIPLPL